MLNSQDILSRVPDLILNYTSVGQEGKLTQISAKFIFFQFEGSYILNIVSFIVNVCCTASYPVFCESFQIFMEFWNQSVSLHGAKSHLRLGRGSQWHKMLGGDEARKAVVWKLISQESWINTWDVSSEFKCTIEQLYLEIKGQGKVYNQ